ncbi:MAG: adenylate cyclase, partial [Okeania sp. SIO2D1]|nr:adenylate cyclase [Okeania sp. SIO2D1]
TDPPEILAAKRRTKDKFERAVVLYHSRAIPEAAHLFQECLKDCKSDRAASMYIERCQQIF